LAPALANSLTTIEDDDAGITYYWEHCGLLHDPAYARRWEHEAMTREKVVTWSELGVDL
jgi:hypothetical protein